MYLVEIDPNTSLLKLDAELTGWMAIPSFAKLYNQENGLKKISAVALFADYLSPLRYYGEKDRMSKVMDVVFEKRDDEFWYNDDIQQAIADYKALQYNHVLEEKSILEDNKIELLKLIRQEEDVVKKQNLMNQLKVVNKNLQDFEKENTGKDLIEESPVRNGYKLSRLENKLENNKSFYYVRKREHIEKEEQKE